MSDRTKRFPVSQSRLFGPASRPLAAFLNPRLKPTPLQVAAMEVHLHNGNLFHHPGHETLASQLELDASDPFQFNTQLDNQHHLQQLQQRTPYDQRPPPPRFQDLHSQVPHNDQLDHAFNRPGQFGVLTPHPQVPSQPQVHHEALGRLQNEIDLRPIAIQDGGTTEGHFKNLKMIPNPPNLEEWRRRLFDVDEVITLTEDE